MWDRFIEEVNRGIALGNPYLILEQGTCRSNPSRPTHRRDLFPGAVYTMTDAYDGLDVDVVSDAHDMPEEWTNRFNALLSCSVFEHLRKPWVAAQECLRVIKPGGLVFVQTHLIFPEHAYPSDFYRFTRMGLASVFEDSGYDCEVETDYSFFADLTPPEEVRPGWNWGSTYPLNVCALVRKRGQS